MKKWGLALVVALVLAGTARGGEQIVTIELKTGERVTGRLVGFADHRYKVEIGDSALGIREEDIRRIEFLDALAPAPTTVAPLATETLTALDLASRLGDVKGMTRSNVRSLGPEEWGFDQTWLPDNMIWKEIGPGLKDKAVVTCTDRADARVVFWRCTKATAAKEAAAKLAKRFTPPGARVTVFHAGPLVAYVVDLGVLASSIAPLDAAVTRVLEAGGPVSQMAGSNTRKLGAGSFATNALPEGIDSFDTDVAQRTEQNVFGDSQCAPHRVTYKGPAGTAEIRFYFYIYDNNHGVVSDRFVLKAPTAEQTAPFNHVWLAESRGVTLTFTGQLPAKTREWFLGFVRGEIAAASDMKDAKLIKSSPPREEAAPAEVTAMDLLPRRDDLPAAFAVESASGVGPTGVASRVKWYRTNNPESNANNVDGLEGVEELATCFYRERAEVAVVVAAYRTAEAARSGLPAVRRAALDSGNLYGDELSNGSEVFSAGRFNAVIRVASSPRGADDRLTPWAQAALRKAIIARLDRAAPGHVASEFLNAPIVSLKQSMLVVPAPWLPEKLDVTNMPLVEREGPPGGTNWHSTVRYESARGAIELSLHDRTPFVPVEVVATSELSGFRSAWLAGGSVVTIGTTGEVSSRTVVWFDRFVAGQLARTGRSVKRLTAELPEPPEPRLARAGDGVPRRDEFPESIRLASESTLDAHSLEAETSYALERSPTTGPLVEAVNADARERVTIAYDKGLLLLDIRSYGSVESARRGFEATKSARPIYENVREVFVAGNLVAFVRDGGETIPAYDAYRAGLVARLESATGGSAVSEAFPTTVKELIASYDGEAARLSLPTELLPKGFTASKVLANHHRPEGTIFESCGTNSHCPIRNVYRSASGTVEVTAYWSGAFPEPSPEQVKPFRHVWLFGGNSRGVSLRVDGTVPENDVAWFIRVVEAELARSPDGKGARRFDAEAAAKPSGDLSVEDLLLEAKDLPRGFKFEKRQIYGKTSIEDLKKMLRAAANAHTVGYGNSVDALAGADELADVTYTERYHLQLVVARYGTEEEARSRLGAFRRAAGSRDGVIICSGSDIFLAGRFLAMIQPGSSTAAGLEALRKVVAAKLERAAPGKVASEALPDATAISAEDAIRFPEGQLPEDCTRSEPRDHDFFASMPYARSSVVYSTPKGAIHAQVYERDRFAGSEPSDNERSWFRSAWLTKDRVVALWTTGDVTSSTLVWLDQAVSAELGRTGETVKRLVTLSAEPRVERVHHAGIEGLELEVDPDEGNNGVKVKAVVPGSRAARIGFQPGDVIAWFVEDAHSKTGIGGEPSRLRDHIASARKAHKKIRIEVKRGDEGALVLTFDD